MFPQQTCGMCYPKMPPEGDGALLYLSRRMLPLEASYERRCPNRPLAGGGGGGVILAGLLWKALLSQLSSLGLLGICCPNRSLMWDVAPTGLSQGCFPNRPLMGDIARSSHGGCCPNRPLVGCWPNRPLMGDIALSSHGGCCPNRPLMGMLPCNLMGTLP